MLNPKPRGIALNRNALNIQQTLAGLRDTTNQHDGPLKPGQLQPQQQPQQVAGGQDNIDQLKAQALSLENQVQPVHLNPIKRLTQLNLSKQQSTNVISDENAHQPQKQAELKPIINLPQSSQQIQAKLDHLRPLKSTSSSSLLSSAKPPTTTAASTLTHQPASLIPVATDKLIEIEDIDKSTSRDAMYLVCDVAKDIYDYMYALESEQSIREDYLKDQKIFTPKVRQRLINWCIDIHQTLRLIPETLYMTISVIDQYFDRIICKQQNLVQLVAVGATLIASKYEEIYPPDVTDLIHLTQNAYSRRDIFKIEIEILETLKFNLGRPIPLAFLRRFSKAAHCDLKMHSIAKYLMELSLTEYECSHWKPSLLAAAALFTTLHLVHGYDHTPPTTFRRFGTRNLSLGYSSTSSASSLSSVSNNSSSISGLISNQSDRWTRTLVHYTHYTKKQLQEPAGILCKILKRAQKSPLSYFCVKKNQANLSKWPELKSTRVDQLIKLSELGCGSQP